MTDAKPDALADEDDSDHEFYDDTPVACTRCLGSGYFAWGVMAFEASHDGWPEFDDDAFLWEGRCDQCGEWTRGGIRRKIYRNQLTPGQILTAEEET